MEKESLKNSDTPHIAVNAQYIKDFSFENLGAPATLVNLKDTPQIDLALDLNIRKILQEGFFEVEISINAKASSKKTILFIVDLKYAGVFNLINIPKTQVQMLLAVDCPSTIFPYARKIIADVTQGGGFQPLMIDPVDFRTLYSKKITESVKQS